MPEIISLSSCIATFPRGHNGLLIKINSGFSRRLLRYVASNGPNYEALRRLSLERDCALGDVPNSPLALYLQQLTKLQVPGYIRFVFGIYSGYAASVRACQGDSACDSVRFISIWQDQPCCSRVAEPRTTSAALEPMLASRRVLSTRPLTPGRS